MNPATNFALARYRNRAINLTWRLVAVVALASGLSTACESKCQPNWVLRNGTCHLEQDASVDGGDARVLEGDADSDPAGTGTLKQIGSAAEAGAAKNPKPPAVDPTIEWMCMRNAAGECTSCKQDADCPKRVCEQGYCMDCRDVSQCASAESCISNRCVPERKPSSIWQSSGGGRTQAAGLKLQLSMGMPMPATNAVASGFKMSVEPGTGNF